MVEESLLQQGLLSQEEIEELHKVFVMIDSDGSGVITLDNLFRIAQEVSKNKTLQQKEVYQLFIQLDVTLDAQVTWDDFLHYSCTWLHSHNFTRPKARTDLPLTISEKQKLHQSKLRLANLVTSIETVTRH